jgi:SAM-dependent methyltransferase
VSAGGSPGPRYTPGWTADAAAFMARRTARSHAEALLPHLRPGLDLVDVGCGPGTITAGLAEAVAPGRVWGFDRDPGQVAQARDRVPGATFAVADAAALPLPDGAAGAGWAHALLEHVPDPVAVLREMRRVVRPGGVIAAVSPDWGGFLLVPPDPVADAAIAAYEAIQSANGGDVHAGRRLGTWMRAAGLERVTTSARYEVYDDPRIIAPYLAARIDRSPELDGADPAEAVRLAAALRDWADRDGAMFAQAWIAATGWVPPPATLLTAQEPETLPTDTS